MKNLTPIGKFLWRFYMMEIYENGNSIGMIWNWWNPISWVLASISFIVFGLYDGFPTAWKNRNEIGIGVHPYFVKNPKQLKWFKRGK